MIQLLGQMADTGLWVLLLPNGTEVHFESEMEARQYMSKLETARAVVACVQSLAPAMDDAPDLWQEHFDRVAQAGTYTDEDLAPLGITADEYLSCVTLLENLKKFFGAEAVNTDAYRIVVNKVRRV